METMKTFLTQRLDGNEELRTQLEWTESDLAVARKAISGGKRLLKKAEEERETTKAEARRIVKGK